MPVSSVRIAFDQFTTFGDLLKYLRRWLEEDHEGLRLHRHLSEAAQEWENRQRDPDGLYRGARLALALEWSGAHAADLNSQERAFLEASQAFAGQESREREAQRQRELEAAQKLAETETRRAEEQASSAQRLRQRGMFLALATFTTLLLTVAAFWFGQRATQNEKLATSRELAAAAVNNLQVDPERSVLLALQALKHADTSARTGVTSPPPGRMEPSACLPYGSSTWSRVIYGAPRSPMRIGE